MLTLRYSPLRELQYEMDRMQDQMRRWFDEVTQAARPVFAPASFPAFNAWEDAENFYVEAELPGLKLEELEIYVSDGRVVTIKGHRPEPTQDKGSWLRRERGYGTFERSLSLPGPIDCEKVEACLKNGVLTVTLPKAPEIRPKRIAVKAS
jgi:HSP20 family protein